MVQSQPRKIVQDSISKILNIKKGLVEWLKVKALSSNPSTKNNDNNKSVDSVFGSQLRFHWLYKMAAGGVAFLLICHVFSVL
jgi:hypothetical protein